MEARFVMDRDYLAVHPHDSIALAGWRAKTSPHRTIYVVEDDGRFRGIVRYADLDREGIVADITLSETNIYQVQPQEDIAPLSTVFAEHPEWRAVPVVDEDGVLQGVVNSELPLKTPQPSQRYDRAVTQGTLQRHLINALHSGLLIVDEHHVVRVLNAYGGELLGVDPNEVLNRAYDELAPFIFPHMEAYLRDSNVFRILTSDTDVVEKEFQVQNGRWLRFFYGQVKEEGQLIAVIVTFNDITALRRAEERAQADAYESEMAFGLVLPNTKVEAKLTGSPEYQDVYDPKTGLATVTAVIPDGTYRHVINGLRIMAELKKLGVFQLVGLDKDTMVQAFIFHDLGKEQPRLAVGQTFVPKDTFEPGYLHAERSADWAVQDYRVSEEVAWLIRYHHTAESDLPAAFPNALLPMLRLMKVVDGLSAGMTRRAAQWAPITLEGTVLTIQESNTDPRYHRAYQLSIYSGEERSLAFSSW